MKVSDEPIVVEQSFENSTEEVWLAITELNRMREWFFDNIEEFEPKIGFKTSFAVQSGERTFTHLWEITEVVPLHKITYRWHYTEYPGDSFVKFELNEKAGFTRLRLSTEVIVDFPDEIPEFKRESAVHGWNYFIGKQLKAYLENYNS